MDCQKYDRRKERLLKILSGGRKHVSSLFLLSDHQSKVGDEGTFSSDAIYTGRGSSPSYTTINAHSDERTK